MSLSMRLLTFCLTLANEGIHGTGTLLSEVLFLCTLFLGEMSFLHCSDSTCNSYRPVDI